MPFVYVQVVGSLSLSQRGALAGAISQVLWEVAGKPPAVTYVQFEEGAGHHWVQGEQTGVFNGVCFPFVEVKAAGALSHAEREGIAAGIEAALASASTGDHPPVAMVDTK